jgi:hypothetical protein
MAGELPPLITRKKLLGSPKRVEPMLSPDGLQLAYLAPDERDVLQIWVRTIGLDDDRCVSKAQRPVQFLRLVLGNRSQNPSAAGMLQVRGILCRCGTCRFVAQPELIRRIKDSAEWRNSA